MTAPDEPRDEEHLAIDLRRLLLALVLAVALAAAALAVVGAVAHFDRLRHAVARAHKPWLAVAVLGQLCAYAGYLLAYRDAARADGGPCFDLATTARIVIVGAGASVLGGSTVGGLAVDFWAIRRARTGVHTAARRVLALGTLEWIVLSGYACTAAVLGLAGVAHVPTGMALGWLIVVGACVAAAAWFTAPARARVLAGIPPAGGGASPRAPVTRPARLLARLLRSGFADAIGGVILVRHLLAHPLRYRGGAIGYPIYWAGEMFCLYAALRGFGAHPQIVGMVLAYATGNAVGILPLPAGGAGGIEAGMAFALHGVGVALAPALLAVLVFRFITFWLPLIPALLLLPGMRELSERLPDVPHSHPDQDERLSFRPLGEPAA